MAKQSGQLKTIEIPYFDGLNLSVGDNISKKTELAYCENVRSNTVGFIEKRGGYRRLGDVITSVGNYGLCYFDDSNASSGGFYRVSTVTATTSLYYLNTTGNWTIFTGNGTTLNASKHFFTEAEGCLFFVNGTNANRYLGPAGAYIYTSADLGSSTTQFDITNTAGSTYRYTYDGTGTDPLITTNVNVGDIVHIIAQNFAAANNGSYTVTAVGANYFEITNAAGSAESNKTIGTGAIRVSNHLTNSPISNKIAYYKDKIYLGDYKIGSTRYPTGITFSSKPLGITSLVDGDHASSSTTINVTDTKYIYSDDILEVYRGGSLITTLFVTAKTETTITVSTTSVALNSSDELWVAGTYTGKRIFRWASNPQSGEDVKQYDTFKLSGSGSSPLTLFDTINNVLVISNKENISTWDENSLNGFDSGISCVSERGYAKGFGNIFFVGYNGLYSFDGSSAPKLLSAKVEPFFTGATKSSLEASAVGIKGNSILVSLAAVTLYNDDESIKKSLTNIVLELNLRQNNWFLHTGLTVADFETYKATDNPDRLEFTGTSGEVYELFRDSSDDSVTTNKEINFNITIPPITLSGEFESYCYPKEIIIETKSGNGIKCFLDTDEKEEWFQLSGDAYKGVSILKVTPRSSSGDSEVRCRTLGISLREMSRGSVKVSKIKIKYAESEEKNLDYPK